MIEKDGKKYYTLEEVDEYLDASIERGAKRYYDMVTSKKILSRWIREDAQIFAKEITQRAKNM